MTAGGGVDAFGSWPPGTAPSVADLRQHLIVTRIAGDVATTRENNLRNFGLMSARDPGYLFGLRPRGPWTPAEVLALMHQRVGVQADPVHAEGQDTIDPDRTIDRLDAMAERLRLAVERQERVILATGHPGGIGVIHLEVARVLRDRGCQILAPAEGWRFSEGDRRRHVRYFAGVAVAASGASLHHTHSPAPMEAMLAELASTGQPPPDLVFGDHGWAGAAGQAGIDSVGFADCNDPALFVGEAEGTVLVSVPADDNVRPRLYAPMTAYLLRHVY